MTIEIGNEQVSPLPFRQRTGELNAHFLVDGTVAKDKELLRHLDGRTNRASLQTHIRPLIEFGRSHNRIHVQLAERLFLGRGREPGALLRQHWRKRHLNVGARIPRQNTFLWMHVEQICGCGEGVSDELIVMNKRFASSESPFKSLIAI